MHNKIPIDKNKLKLWLRDGKLIEKYYAEKVKKYSMDSYASLDWSSYKDHKVFLNNVISGISLSKVDSVLDIGCGQAGLLKYLIKLGKKPSYYEGVDVLGPFITKVRRDFKETDFVFKKINFLDEKYWPVRKCDLIVNLGGLNSKVRYHYDYLKYNVEKMLLCSNKYVVFNLITATSESYFHGGKARRVGSIGTFRADKLLSIIRKLSKEHPFSYRINKVSIFKGSVDTFVYITL